MFDKLKEGVAKLQESKPGKVSAEQVAGHVHAAKPEKGDAPRQGAGSNGGGGAF
jgi:hypothetical protein